MKNRNVNLKNRSQVVSKIDTEVIALSKDGKEIIIDEKNIEHFSNNSITRKFIDNKLKFKKYHKSNNISKAFINLGFIGKDYKSDKGHYRFLPKGKLVYNLIKDWLDYEVNINLKSTEIKTPTIYNWNDESIRKQSETFYENLYFVNDFSGNKEFIMRFGGDLGLFSLLSDLSLNHNQLPLRLYEFSESYRYEKSGGLKGIERTRTFSFHDIHDICANEDKGIQKYLEMLEFQLKLSESLEFNFCIEFTIDKDFYDKFKPYLIDFQRRTETEIIILLISNRKHYWSIKHVFIDENLYKYFNSQLDFINSGNYNVFYKTENSGSKPCVICHTSLASIERWMCILFQRYFLNNKPIPLWLLPTHVRVIPENEDLIQQAEEIHSKLSKFHLRADIDDNFNDSFENRQTQSINDLAYYTISLRENNFYDNVFETLSLNDSSIVFLELDEIIKDISNKIKDWPYRPTNNIYLSKSLTFKDKK